MKFVKLQLNNVPKEGTVLQWRMVIDNTDDLLKYHKLDIERYTKTLIGMDLNKHQPSGRPSAIKSFLDIHSNSIPEGQKGDSPVMVLAKVLNKKTLGMLKVITELGPICINESGGYCTLTSFLETWDGKILQEIIKDDIGFPVDIEPEIEEFLILENDSNKPYEISQYMEINKISSFSMISNLKEKDLSFVLKCILKSKTIAFRTQLQDEEQNKMFLNAFLNVPRKNILIFTEAVDKLVNNNLFIKNQEVHNIIVTKV